MSKMIQIRHVPEELHRALKARAAEAGQTLSDYLLAELRWIAEVPTLEAWARRVRRRGPVEGELDAARIIREMRDGR